MTSFFFKKNFSFYVRELAEQQLNRLANHMRVLWVITRPLELRPTSLRWTRSLVHVDQIKLYFDRFKTFSEVVKKNYFLKLHVFTKCLHWRALLAVLQLQHQIQRRSIEENIFARVQRAEEKENAIQAKLFSQVRTGYK